MLKKKKKKTLHSSSARSAQSLMPEKKAFFFMIITPVLTKPRSVCPTKLSNISLFSPTHASVKTLSRAISCSWSRLAVRKFCWIKGPQKAVVSELSALSTSEYQNALEKRLSRFILLSKKRRMRLGEVKVSSINDYSFLSSFLLAKMIFIGSRVRDKYASF